MLRKLGSKPLCSACSRQLADLFIGGFAARPRRAPSALVPVAKNVRTRKFHSTRPRRDISNLPESEIKDESERAALVERRLEEKAREARQLFGESLPLDYLSAEEFKVYERLYGFPLNFTEPEKNSTAETHDHEGNTLLKEIEDGYTSEVEADGLSPDGITFGTRDDTAQEAVEIDPHDSRDTEGFETAASEEEEAMIDDLQDAQRLAQRQKEELEQIREPGSSEETWSEYNDGEEEDESDYSRTHPLTQAGRFSTAPRTVVMPAIEMTAPIQRRLAESAKYKHLIEAAEKAFGGKHLPDSNATPRKIGRNLQQKPIPLSASQFRMTQLEANLFLSTIMPGAYATATSILVEVRKRLGSSWLEDLLKRPGGPRVLDAGGGGAGVIAWRNVLAAEWDRMHEESGRVAQDLINLGSSTVLAGSEELQAAVSQMLSDTTFIPRLPDFNRQTDLPGAEEGKSRSRRTYDVIIAPYSIWQIEEDYMRKAHVQNLWSLLDPNGGVLIISEKGLPRGFEAIAGAREVLLNHHIGNPQTDVQEHMEATGHKHTQMEEGMIVAPCTNHTTCPLYKIPGEMVGRKDFCSFKQRFERPPFLQRIVGAKHQNHEDIGYSYLAVRRGKDQRQELGFQQDEEATQAAFKGYEEVEEVTTAETAAEEQQQQQQQEQSPPPPPSMLTLPRIMSPPLKRTGHVTFDLCTPAGTFERWTTPKSFSKLAYRDGRKARWGDLWALGAKTRLDHPVRTGRPKDGSKTSSSKVARALKELGGDADGGMDGGAIDVAGAPKPLKRGDKGWKRKIGRRPKYGNNPMTRKVDMKDQEL